MGTMSNKKAVKNTSKGEKLELLREQQSKWIKQRSHALSKEVDSSDKNNNHSSNYASSTPIKSSNLSGVKNSKSKTTPVLWASSSNSEYNGFVVRKPPATKETTGSRRPTSAKTTSSTTDSKTPKKKPGDQTTSKKMNTTKDTTTVPESASDYGSVRSGGTVRTTEMDLSDDLCSKVKCELYVQNSFTAEDAASSNTTQLTNHCCPTCKEVMIGPHSPRILIPCGHSFCSLCSSGFTSSSLLCPLCRTEVSSVEVNETLVKIITHFQIKLREDEARKREEDAQKYIDEYQTLHTRTTAMKGTSTTANLTIPLIDEFTVKYIFRI